MVLIEPCLCFALLCALWAVAGRVMSCPVCHILLVRRAVYWVHLLMDGFVLQRWPSRAMGVNAKHLGHRMKVHDGYDDDDDGNRRMGNAQREKGYWESLWLPVGQSRVGSFFPRHCQRAVR